MVARMLLRKTMKERKERKQTYQSEREVVGKMKFSAENPADSTEMTM